MKDLMLSMAVVALCGWGWVEISREPRPNHFPAEMYQWAWNHCGEEGFSKLFVGVEFEVVLTCRNGTVHRADAR